MSLPPNALGQLSISPSLTINSSTAAHDSSWFALFTYPRHEKKVAENLLAREVESFLPLYPERRRWRNRQTVEISVPLFPGYVFARFDRTQRIRVVSLPGVVNIVEGARNAGEIPEQYIQTLRSGVQLGRIRPYRDPIIGDRVRVTSGPLLGLEGVLVHFRAEFRVVLSIEMIGQSVAIEVSRDEIEPVPSRTARRMA